MKRYSRKLERVTWPSDAKLGDQVRSFHKDPLELNGGHQDTLEAKTSSSGIVNNDFPPGFEHGPYGIGLKHGPTNMPNMIKWTHPPKFDLKYSWHVAAGEKSEDFLAQEYRVKRIRAVRAAYPCLAAVPPCPADFSKLEAPDYDDSRTPIIPLEVTDVTSHFTAQRKAPHFPASAAESFDLKNSPSLSFNVALTASTVVTAASASAQPSANLAAAAAAAATEVKPLKDINCIRNLIKEHGTQKREDKRRTISQTGSHFNQTQKNLNPGTRKFGKACLFFNTPQGCRQGSNCLYLHDESFQLQIDRMLEAPDAKRMKF